MGGRRVEKGQRKRGRGKSVVEECRRVRVSVWGEKSREGKKRMRGGRWKEREWSV